MLETIGSDQLSYAPQPFRSMPLVRLPEPFDHPGEDLREWPLIERKRRLRQLIPSVPTPAVNVDHIQARGRDFFKIVCAHDLEGIVAKPASGRYRLDGTSTIWIKVKQMTARHELFESRGGTKPTRKKVPLLALRVAGEAGARWLSTRCAESLGRQTLIATEVRGDTIRRHTRY